MHNFSVLYIHVRIALSLKLAFHVLWIVPMPMLLLAYVRIPVEVLGRPVEHDWSKVTREGFRDLRTATSTGGPRAHRTIMQDTSCLLFNVRE